MAYTSTEKIIGVVTEFKNALYTRSRKMTAPIDRDQFVLLLSAVASCRKWPMLSEPMGFDSFYKCRNSSEREQVAEWLDKTFKVDNWVSLDAACNSSYNIHDEYKQFWAEWNGISSFNNKKYEPAMMFKMKRCNEYAKKFSHLLGDAGFFAWDCNERIGLCRVALACNVINEEEFWYAVLPYAKKASKMFSNWIEYGISYLLGQVYHTYQQKNCNEDITQYFKIAYGIINYLFDNHWGDVAWYQFSEEYTIAKNDMKPLLKGWEGPDSCIATNRITVDNCPVGIMYRQEADANFNDSGWRFYQGREDDEYAYDMTNSGLHKLNDICNYDPAIIPYLNSPVGTTLRRTADGKFEVVENEMGY